MLRLLLIFGTVVVVASANAAAQASARVEPSDLHGPRPLLEQTQSAAIRDYLRAWQVIGAALEENNANLLDRDFVGAARDKLAETIKEQSELGIRTRYQDKSHDLRIVFYSPEGLSIQLTDNVEYSVQVLDHDKVQTTQQVRARYIVVMTPTEVRWRVRLLQARAE